MKRSECKDGPRPCCRVSCKYHLLLDIGAGGSINAGYGHTLRAKATPEQVDAWAEEQSERLISMPETCALDIADEGGGIDNQAIADALGISREAVRQIIDKATDKIKVKITEEMQELIEDESLVAYGFQEITYYE